MGSSVLLYALVHVLVRERKEVPFFFYKTGLFLLDTIFWENYISALELLPILQLCFQTFKTDIVALHTTNVYQIRHFLHFSPPKYP